MESGICEGYVPDNHADLVVPLMSSLQSLGEAADLVHPQLADHHKLAGFVAASVAAAMGLSPEEQEALLCAGLVHDIGAFSATQRLDVARFDAEDVFPHCLTGCMLLRDFPSLAHIADIVRNHHIRWDHGHGLDHQRDGAERSGHILHLADRVAVGIREKEGNPLEIGKRVIRRIRDQSGKMFDPELVEVFRSLGREERFWFEVSSLSDEIVARYWQPGTVFNGTMPMSEMAHFFGRVIDFRSSFTATHSKSVSAVAERLGLLVGLFRKESRLLNVAGHLHDLGKLGVPIEIIEKPGRLTDHEYDIMKIHPYHTLEVLRKVPGLEGIARWCGYHHEFLDGSGYPFHLKADAICIQSRILSVADTFTALTEDRPYRRGMPSAEVRRILGELAAAAKLDHCVVGLATRHYDEIYQCMLAVQPSEMRSY
ncbi:MAG: HD domain-containing phosphohydrolase, partial [Pseudomonadota bacterium]